MVDCGYRGHGVETTKVLISGHKTWHHPAPGKAPQATKRHRAGDRAHKSDGRLARSPLKGCTADAIFAVLCACGHNVRKILAHLRALLFLLLHLIAAMIWREKPCQREASAA